MAEPFEANYYKITTESELPRDQPVIYRAAGATVVLRRTGNSVEAIDGSCLTDDSQMSPQVRLQRIQECVAAGIGSKSSDWSELASRAGLPVKVSNGDVWVCLDGCRK